MEFISREAIVKALSKIYGKCEEAVDSTLESPKFVYDSGKEILFKNQGMSGVAAWLRENYKEDNEIQKILDEGSKEISKNEKNAQINAMLVNGVQQTMTEDSNYKNWLMCCAKFPKYSFNNTMLIHIQKPDASYVCGYQQWIKDFDRHVKKGEKGITIYAPIIRKETYKVPEKNITGHYIQGEDGTIKTVEVTKQYTTFRAISVFDVSQTEGKELPAICKELQGDVEDFNELLDAAKKASVVPVEFVDPKELNGAKGCFIPAQRIIHVSNEMSEVQTFKTLIHEMAHAKLGHGLEDCKLTRQERELTAESVAFIVCANLGINTSDYSFEYLSSWAQGDSAKMMDLMSDIQTAAKEIVNDISLNRKPALRQEYFENLWENRNNKPLLAVYQLPNDHDFAFMDYEDMLDSGYIPSIEDFELKYVTEDTCDKDLEQIYMELNANDRPNADNMRSLSVGDVIIKYDGSEDNVYMVNAIGFTEIEGFDQARQRTACR